LVAALNGVKEHAVQEKKLANIMAIIMAGASGLYILAQDLLDYRRRNKGEDALIMAIFQS
jgi:hypothetical protein